MKRVSLVVALLGAIALAFASVALAGGGYATQPGATVAMENTVCAGHGAFGAFGTTGDLDIHDFGIKGGHDLGADDHPGADGPATGLNNSSLCGSR